MNQKGSTLAEVLLSLFILAIVTISFNRFYYLIQNLIYVDSVNQQIAQIAKNKMEEIKSGYVYINEEKLSITDLNQDHINFNENNYKVDIFINFLSDNTSSCYVNVVVNSQDGESQYNLVRYINLNIDDLPVIYEELDIGSS